MCGDSTLQAVTMRRRELITIIGGAALTWPLVARAAANAKRLLIAVLLAGRRDADAPFLAAFLDGMRDFGSVEGQSFDTAYRFADENYAELQPLAEELVQLKPDVIVTSTTPAALAAQKATQSIPIVATALINPVHAGLVVSYARPGYNVTGILFAVEGLLGKQVEIAVELVPGATAIGLLANTTSPIAMRQEIEAAGVAKVVKIVTAEVRARADLDSSLKSLTSAGVQAIIVLPDPMLLSERRSIADFSTASRIPTVSWNSKIVEAGGLISYGVNAPAAYRRAAYFVDRIMKGAKPADLPVEFPTKIELVINVKTAKTLGLTLPQSLLVRADQLIE